MRKLIGDKQPVAAGVYYAPQLILFTGIEEAKIFNLNARYVPLTRAQRLGNKLAPGKFTAVDTLSNWLQNEDAALVVLSQGNNIEGFELMQLCKQLKLKYITLTHLVVESVWPGLNDEKINLLIQLYERAEKNFFVSSFTKQLHEKMLGYSSTNAAYVHNPFTKNSNEVFAYPSISVYKIALIGRVETFHKGYDLLLEVLKDEKWKRRPLQFSIYGEGPHKQLLGK